MNPRQFALFLGFYLYVLNVNAANDAQRVILLSSLIQIGHLKRDFFCGTNVEEDVEDVAFPVFAGFCQDHSSRGLTHIILILQFQETNSGKQKYALCAIEYSFRPRLTSQNVKRKKVKFSLN